MRKIRPMAMAALLLALLTLSVGCGNPPEPENIADGKLRVVASFYTMADFAEKIGGDLVSITTMTPPGTEPHDWEPSPGELAAMLNADVFIYSGAGFEAWADAALVALAGKDSSVIEIVEASAGIHLLDEDAHDDDDIDHDEDSHSHSGSDPHVWLSPENAKKQMANILEAFVQADPQNAEIYRQNYEKWTLELDKLDMEYKTVLDSAIRREVVVSHEAYGYLCDAYGLTQMGIEGLIPDSEPDPKRMAELIRFVRDNDVRVIFYEEAVSPASAETIANETGAKIMVLSPIEYISVEGGDYFSVMRKNLEALQYALCE